MEQDAMPCVYEFLFKQRIKKGEQVATAHNEISYGSKNYWSYWWNAILSNIKKMMKCIGVEFLFKVSSN